MTTAFQPSAFQSNAFQVDSGIAQLIDLDKGGPGQWALIDRGPSLGTQMVRVVPQVTITTAGQWDLGPDASIVFINVADFVDVLLPPVATWLQQNFSQFPNAFGGGILVKDLGGNAGAFNITVATSLLSESIDLGANYIMNQNFQAARFIPLNDLSGWMVG